MYSAYEIRTLVLVRRAEDGVDVVAVLGADDGVLVFVSHAAVVGEGFGEPVGGTDEGGFSVYILYLFSHNAFLKMI